MNDLAQDISPSISLYSHDESLSPIDPFHLSLALRKGLHVSQHAMWVSEATTFEAIERVGKVVMSHERPHENSLIVELADSLVLVTLGHGHFQVVVAASTSTVANATIEALRHMFPAKCAADGTLLVTFHSARGLTHRRIAVPDWKSVCDNYPTGTREHLQQLAVCKEGAASQLLLWHGLPGTGKTYALRALGWEWRDWCDLHYIVDPEAFFGNADYMLKTVMTEPRTAVGEKPRWRLFIAEDTGELLAKDAKMRTGQGLSRLLNIVDGLIGQGLRIMVLITTNERLSAMHEAVIRPGRCSNALEFQPFSAEAANAWLAERGRAPLVGTKPRTLAELYAGAESAVQGVIGFVPARDVKAKAA